MKYFIPFAMILMANGSFCAELKDLGLYSEKFFQKGQLVYEKGESLFIRDCYGLNYVAEDTVLFEFSKDMQRLDSVYVPYGFAADGVSKIAITADSYLFHTHQAIIQINRNDKQKIRIHELGKPFYTYIRTGDYLYPINSIPGSMNPENIQFQRLLFSENDKTSLVKRDTSFVELPPIKGFDLMYVQPRMEVAFFDDYLLVADPCIENLYYYDFKGKLVKSVRLDSLLNIKGACSQFESFKGNKKAPKRNFDKLLDISFESKILRSVENYKGRLLVRVTTSSHECDTYIIDPESLKWVKLEYGRYPGKFSSVNIPIDNFTIIDGDYVINTIESDIKDLDLSQFKSYDEFKKYTEENKNTGTSYLVREIVFE